MIARVGAGPQGIPAARVGGGTPWPWEWHPDGNGAATPRAARVQRWGKSAPPLAPFIGRLRWAAGHATIGTGEVSRPPPRREPLSTRRIV